MVIRESLWNWPVVQLLLDVSKAAAISTRYTSSLSKSCFVFFYSTSSSKRSINLDYLPHIRQVLTRPLMTQVCTAAFCWRNVSDYTYFGSCVVFSYITVILRYPRKVRHATVLSQPSLALFLLFPDFMNLVLLFLQSWLFLNRALYHGKIRYFPKELL